MKVTFCKQLLKWWCYYCLSQSCIQILLIVRFSFYTNPMSTVALNLILLILSSAEIQWRNSLTWVFHVRKQKTPDILNLPRYKGRGDVEGPHPNSKAFRVSVSGFLPANSLTATSVLQSSLWPETLQTLSFHHSTLLNIASDSRVYSDWRKRGTEEGRKRRKGYRRSSRNEESKEICYSHSHDFRADTGTEIWEK